MGGQYTIHVMNFHSIIQFEMLAHQLAASFMQIFLSPGQSPLDYPWQARKQIFGALGQTDLRERDHEMGLYSPVAGICAGCKKKTPWFFDSNMS